MFAKNEKEEEILFLFALAGPMGQSKVVRGGKTALKYTSVSKLNLRVMGQSEIRMPFHLQTHHTLFTPCGESNPSRSQLT